MTNEYQLPVITAAIIAAGFYTLNSAAQGSSLVTQQLVALALGSVGIALILLLGRERLLRLTLPAYVASIILLILVQVMGTEVNNAQSWLKLGPLPGFQPSEIAKIALVLALASTMHKRPISTLLDYVRPVVLFLIPIALVYLEPDLGGTLTLAAIGAGMILLRGVPRKHLIIALTLIAVAIPTVVWPRLAPYQKQRVFTFLDPTADPLGSGYQVLQARIAIGSGGLLGKGYKQGTQGQLGFIPEHHNDFIFAVLAEEGGLVAALIVLSLYGLLFWRLISMASECTEERHTLVIFGVTIMIGFQVLVNIGVTLGLAPVTGITLPLMSYGGTSLISTLLALGIAYVVHRDRFKP